MIDKFLQEQKINGMKDKTIENYAYVLKKVNEYKPVICSCAKCRFSWSKNDINNYLTQLDLKESSIQIHKIVLRTFFTWLKNPQIIENLKVNIKTEPLKQEDVLTSEDVNLLIESTNSHMYKALIALLFESGARINEVLAITKKDISETDRGMIIRIPQTKTGNDRRTILSIFSAQYIRNHLNYSAITDKIFPVSDMGVWDMLKKIGKKSGIEKPISAHKFRHAQASDMVRRGYQESIIRKKLGWSPDSKMIERYIHLNDDDVVNATAEMTGSEIPKQPMTNLKQAESLKIADASLQLSKLSAENEELKQKQAAMEELINTIAKKLDIGDMPRSIGMVKKWEKA